MHLQRRCSRTSSRSCSTRWTASTAYPPQLWGAVASVDERCRKLLRVVAFMDRPDYQTLSTDLDMPVGSIGPTRARCLAKVRTALMKGGER